MLAPEHPAAPLTSPAATAVFSTVLTRGPVSRVEIAHHTGLSSAAVTKVSRPFIDAGYLEEVRATGRVDPGPGRPASPLAIRDEREFFAGVKITENELIGVITDLRARVVAWAHRPLASPDVDDAVEQIATLVSDLLATSPAYTERCHSLGLATSGDVDRSTGLVRYSPFLDWHQVPLGQRVASATSLTVTVENDVKAVTVAEQWFGHGIGAPSFALVTLGIGIGCGLVVDGRLVMGARGVAGEIGHIPVAGDEAPCHCGGRGCVEAVAGTRAIVDAVRDATGERALDIRAAIDLAHAGDAAARAVFDRAGHAIGLAIAAMANLIGPERIIVTGDEAGLAAYDLFEEQITETFRGQAFGAALDCRIILHPIPFEQWARGAAAVAIQCRFTL